MNQSVRDGGDYSTETLVGLGAPAPDHQQVVSRIDEYNVAATADCLERICWRTGPESLLCIEPPQETIVGTVGAGRGCHLHIRRRNNLTVAPLAASEPEQTKPRQVIAADPHASTPACATADRRHPLAIDIHVGVGIGHPLPCRRAADGIHDLVAKYFRNRFLEDFQK